MKRNRIFSKAAALSLAFAMAVTLTPAAAFADTEVKDNAPLKAEVRVTVSEKGVIAETNGRNPMALKSVTAEDTDGNGAVTVKEVMEAAHKKYKKADDFALSTAGWVTSLWGDKSGNFLFHVNNEGFSTAISEMPVKDGDIVTASVNKDDIYYADWYTFFDKNEITVKENEEFTLNLKGHPAMTGGENKALSGIRAGIVKDGAFVQKDKLVTDEDGNVKMKFDKPGVYFVSASGTVEQEVIDWSQEPAGEVMVKADCPVIAPACIVKVGSYADRLRAGTEDTKVRASSKRIRGGIQVSWKKAPGYKVDGYEVYKSDSRNGKYKIAYKTKNTTWKNTKGLVKGKTYYYKVRGYRTVGGEKVYTRWSPKAYRTVK